MALTMLPPAELLPDVLPTDRLTASGKPVPAVREELRHISDAGNAFTVLGVYLQSFGVIALAVWIGQPWAYAVAFVLMGRAHCMYNILGHEAAHRLLFSDKRVNDFVGKWFVAYPSFQAIDPYRRAHMAHHREEFGPNEPDLKLYNGYPITRDSFWRKMRRDAFFITGWKTLKPLLQALGKKSSRRIAVQILGVQVVILGIFTLAGRPWLYPLLWLAPWMTVWRVLNRLRAIAEHGGMTRSPDRRLTTHVIRQHWWARFWMVPYNTGWHLAHHVDIGIPWRNLPAFHRELVAAGWVPEGLEYPNYRALWRALRAG
jgi:fatty acid desaturase